MALPIDPLQLAARERLTHYVIPSTYRFAGVAGVQGFPKLSTRNLRCVNSNTPKNLIDSNKLGVAARTDGTWEPRQISERPNTLVYRSVVHIPGNPGKRSDFKYLAAGDAGVTI